MNKILKITEKELLRTIKKNILESTQPEGPEMPEIPPADYDEVIASYKAENNIGNDGDDEMVNQIAEYWNNRRLNKKI